MKIYVKNELVLPNKRGDVIKNHKEVIIVNAFGILNEYLNLLSVFVGKSLNEEFKNISGQVR